METKTNKKMPICPVYSLQKKKKNENTPDAHTLDWLKDYDTP